MRFGCGWYCPFLIVKAVVTEAEALRARDARAALPYVSKSSSPRRTTTTSTYRRRPLPASPTRNRAAKLSAHPKPKSKWPSNRLLAYVMALSALGSCGMEANDWNADAPTTDCPRPVCRYGCVELLQWMRNNFWASKQAWRVVR